MQLQAPVAAAPSLVIDCRHDTAVRCVGRSNSSSKQVPTTRVPNETPSLRQMRSYPHPVFHPLLI